MDIFKEIMASLSTIGINFINHKIDHKINTAKKNAMLIYIVHIIAQSISTLLIISLSLFVISLSPNLQSNLQNFKPRDYFLIALFLAFFLIILILSYKLFKAKEPHLNNNFEKEKNEVLSKLIPLAEKLFVSYLEANSTNKKVDALKQQNQDLQSTIHNLSLQVQSLTNEQKDK